MGIPSDFDLIRQLQAGDTRAFEALFDRHYPAIYGYLRVSLSTREDAEDILQRVFEKVYKATPRFEIRPGKAFLAWLFTIAKNEVMIERRSQAPLPTDDLEALAEVAEDSAPPASAWGVEDPQLRALLDRLPLAQRQVLFLRFECELSTNQIAELLERTEPGVRQLQARALAFLEPRCRALGWNPQGNVARQQMIRHRELAPVVAARRLALSYAAVN